MRSAELALPTQRSRRRFSQQATSLPRNLTFADAAEKVTRSDGGHSQVAITDLGKVPAARAPAQVQRIEGPYDSQRIAPPVAVGGVAEVDGGPGAERAVVEELELVAGAVDVPGVSEADCGAGAEQVVFF